MPNEILEPANQDNSAASPEAAPAEVSTPDLNPETSATIPDAPAEDASAGEAPAPGGAEPAAPADDASQPPAAEPPALPEQQFDGSAYGQPAQGPATVASTDVNLNTPEVSAAVAAVLNVPPARHPVIDLQEVLFGYKISLNVDRAVDTHIGLTASKTMSNGDTAQVSDNLLINAPAQAYADFASRAVNQLVGAGL